MAKDKEKKKRNVEEIEEWNDEDLLIDEEPKSEEPKKPSDYKDKAPEDVPGKFRKLL